MKGIDIFCASQAATSIRLSMEESGGSSTIYLGGNTSGRALDRYNPIIRDDTRITKVLPLNTTARPPCSSSNQPPITLKPHPHKKNSRKNPSKETNNHHQHQNKKIISSKQNDDNSSSGSNITKKKSFSSSSWSCTKPGEFISPPGSSRYLLTTHKSSFSSDHFDPLLSMVPAGLHSTASDQAVDHKKDDIVVVDDDESSTTNTSKLPSSSSSSADQVVVLKVSLHCKGCERKMKKHLSKMEGVTSFKIDFAAKKLTVVGDVTPLSVLASVSKVKNAQLLTPLSAPPLVSSIPSVGSNISEIKKDKGIVV